MTRRRIIILFVMLAYFAIAGYGLAVLDASLLVTNFILFGIPALLLARYSVAPPSVIMSVTFLGLGLGVLLEGLAHIYGLWYTLGVNEVSFLGIMPLEGILAIAVEVLFLALLYENLFDDGEYTTRSARNRSQSFVLFSALIITAVSLSYWFRDVILVEGVYLYLVLVLLAISFFSLATYRTFSVLFLDRVLYFTMVAVIPLSASLILSVMNVHKVFGNPAEYVAVFDIVGNGIPLEAMVMVFALPVLVGTIYEIYLDDKS